MIMRNLVLSAITACLFATGPAAAFDISEMSDAERETFREEIHNYLLDNPEVIMEAVRVLAARQSAARRLPRGDAPRLRGGRGLGTHVGVRCHAGGVRR